MKLCKKILRIASLAFVILMLMSGTVLAAYSRYATVQVLETGGVLYNYLPIIVDIDNDYLADNGYISLTGLDTRILSGSTELKHLVTDDKVLFVIPLVGANSTGSYRYTLGNDLQDSFPIITGLDGHITITDADSLDGGAGGMDNFGLELKGYVDTSSGADKNLVYKEGAIRVYVSDTGNITALLGATRTITLRPNATGDENTLPLSDPTIPSDDHWQNVDEEIADDHDTTVGNYLRNSEWRRDLYNVEDHSGVIGVINSVKVYAKLFGSSGPEQVSAAIAIKTGGSVYEGTEFQVTGTYTLYSKTWTTNPADSQPWGSDWAVIDALQIGIKLRQCKDHVAEGFQTNCTQVYVEVEYTDEIAVTVTGITSGERIITASADSSDLILSVTDYDDVHLGNSPQTTDLLGYGFFPNGNDWILSQNNVMPYMEYYKHTVAGTLIAWYQPLSMIIGTTLDDREGTDAGETGTAEEDGAITWGSNPADLSATIGSLISSSQPEIVPAGEEEAIDIVPEGEVPAAGGEVNTTKLEDNPLHPFIAMASEYTGYTEEQIWFMLATFFILIAMGISAVKVPNHLLLAGTVGLVAGGFFTAMEIYSWWMMLIFGFMFVMTILMERKPTF